MTTTARLAPPDWRNDGFQFSNEYHHVLFVPIIRESEGNTSKHYEVEHRSQFCNGVAYVHRARARGRDVTAQTRLQLIENRENFFFGRHLAIVAKPTCCGNALRCI